MSRDPNTTRLLSKGTPKQRALMIANHIAECERTGKGFLSEVELSALTDSFKKPNEIDLYNEIKRRYKSAQMFLMNLSQIRLTYAEALARLDRLLILKKSNLDIEELVNRILLHIPDKAAKKKAIDAAKSFSNPALLRSIKAEGDFVTVGGLAFDSIDEDIAILQETVLTEQVNLKTALRAIRDFMDETGLKVTVFKNFVKDVESWAKSDLERGPHIRATRAQRRQRGDDGSPLIEAPVIERDFDEVEIDQELYTKFRKDFLNG